MSGYVNYAGEPINLSFDINQALLQSAESGAALCFSFMNSSETELHDTAYTEYYSAAFAPWKTKFKDVYEEYNKNISKVYNSLISNHEYLTEKVTQTTYDNGYSVFVNYGYTDFVSDSGVTIPARQYKVLKVEE